MIIFDDKHIFEFGFEVEPGHDDPITPIFEHKTLSIPGLPGLWNFGSETRERALSFTLIIMENTIFNNKIT